VDKVAGRSSNAAAPSFERIANVPGMTSAALTAALRTSHETMLNVIIKGNDRLCLLQSHSITASKKGDRQNPEAGTGLINSGLRSFLRRSFRIKRLSSVQYQSWVERLS
jgi:hypothetical protein